ncbi:hypothetical protein J8273_1884 [Carpediemonas membranifera]|uniref:Uncharacterized protein n=1 Tax=Carpediemonas membranifera TaxID=201153 RepID=A0A8J6BG76_9EUKA|nr:hypothetical protein J8273_1884 [Carpediemonas membranifera]|eukprot:KAG9396837.1 hypothetical protein J8273_1884 [Carpediemonas membranifera]
MTAEQIFDVYRLSRGQSFYWKLYILPERRCLQTHSHRDARLTLIHALDEIETIILSEELQAQFTLQCRTGVTFTYSAANTPRDDIIDAVLEVADIPVRMSESSKPLYRPTRAAPAPPARLAPTPPAPLNRPVRASAETWSTSATRPRAMEVYGSPASVPQEPDETRYDMLTVSSGVSRPEHVMETEPNPHTAPDPAHTHYTSRPSPPAPEMGVRELGVDAAVQATERVLPKLTYELDVQVSPETEVSSTNTDAITGVDTSTQVVGPAMDSQIVALNQKIVELGSELQQEQARNNKSVDTLMKLQKEHIVLKAVNSSKEETEARVRQKVEEIEHWKGMHEEAMERVQLLETELAERKTAMAEIEVRTRDTRSASDVAGMEQLVTEAEERAGVAEDRVDELEAELEELRKKEKTSVDADKAARLVMELKAEKDVTAMQKAKLKTANQMIADLNTTIGNLRSQIRELSRSKRNATPPGSRSASPVKRSPKPSSRPAATEPEPAPAPQAVSDSEMESPPMPEPVPVATDAGLAPAPLPTRLVDSEPPPEPKSESSPPAPLSEPDMDAMPPIPDAGPPAPVDMPDLETTEATPRSQPPRPAETVEVSPAPESAHDPAPSAETGDADLPVVPLPNQTVGHGGIVRLDATGTSPSVQGALQRGGNPQILCKWSIRDGELQLWDFKNPDSLASIAVCRYETYIAARGRALLIDARFNDGAATVVLEGAPVSKIVTIFNAAQVPEKS